jgi:hypothetical protein
MQRLPLRFMLSVCALLVVTGHADATTMVKPMALEEVAKHATRIVHGTVTATTAGRDEFGAPATWVTLEVKRTVKGAVGSTLTIKQFGVVDPLPDGTVTRLPGMPRYTVGDEVVLFLWGDSRRGFTSPVGLEQGVYRVQAGMARAASSKDAEPIDAFLSKITRLNAWNK